MLDAGSTRLTVLDVICEIAVNVMSNGTNHVAHTALDTSFDTNRRS